MLRRILQIVAGWFGLGSGSEAAKRPEEQAFVLQTFEDRRSATAAASRPGVAALVQSGERAKWLLMLCPCGCGQQIALNLMSSHSPRWEVKILSKTSFSVHPSVDATSCGAHFWLRNGRVIWCQ
ncbi:DUF6527 family protein [Acidovorax radicis]|uniref:DUF6527 family protein n=1 Tax=Acidovorax radicis TaxID=758826 RepID=UPI001C6117DF